MDIIKKAGIVAGAVVGGAIGGTLSLIGKVAKVPLIDDIGESVVDSTILTGKMAGTVVSGASDLIAGAVSQDKEKRDEGITDIKDTGKQVVHNFTGNIKLVAGSGGEILSGVRHGNAKTVKRGFKSLIKVASVGFLTVGAIKIKEEKPAEIHTVHKSIKRPSLKK